MKYMQWYTLVLASLLTVSGCAPHRPAEVVDRTSQQKQTIITSISETQKKPEQIKVKTGDTLYKLGFAYNIDYKRLAEYNNIARPYIIFPGQTLRLTAPENQQATTQPIPASKTVITQAVKINTPLTITTNPTPENNATRQQQVPPENPSSNTAVAKPTTSNQQITNSEPQVKQNAPQNTNSQAATQVTQSNAVDQAKLKTTLSWSWPTKGKILSTYLASNPARKGISIGGDEGQNITAAETGVVVYSGNGLLGYGELIIIKHNETFLSAYGHNKRRLVQEGQLVEKGQKIAELGSSGTNVNNLHFEIRKNGDPVNPLNFLP